MCSRVMGAHARFEPAAIEVEGGDRSPASTPISPRCPMRHDPGRGRAVRPRPDHRAWNRNWRVKETDRMAAVAAELGKLGARTEVGADSLTVHPPRASAPRPSPPTTTTAWPWPSLSRPAAASRW
jgi:hypothetical protein